MKPVKMIVFLAIAAISVTVCFQDLHAAQQEEIVVTGYGVAPDDVTHPGKRKLLARLAAITDAYWNFACIIEEVRVSGSTRMRDYMIESHDVYLKVDAFIKGAEIVSENEIGSGIYEVRMMLPLKGKDGLFSKMGDLGVKFEEPRKKEKQHTAIQLTVKMRGINPVAKVYVNRQEILKYNKSAQYIYYDFLKIYDDSDEHEILLETQTYGYKNYVVFKKKDGEVLLEKNLTAYPGEFNEYVCIAEFDYWSLECHNVNPRGYAPE